VHRSCGTSRRTRGDVAPLGSLVDERPELALVADAERLLDQVGELRCLGQGRDHRVDVVDRPLGEVAPASGPQFVEQVGHVVCTDLHQLRDEPTHELVVDPVVVVDLLRNPRKAFACEQFRSRVAS
jgi:hypothetical protein